MKNSSGALVGAALALLAPAVFAAAPAALREHDASDSRPRASAAVVQPVAANPSPDADAAGAASGFSAPATALVLGAIGALALVVRRRGID